MLDAPRPIFRDRDDEEIRGYRDALKWIHEHHADIPVSEETILQLHRMTRSEIWDAGHYKDKDGDITKHWSRAPRAGMRASMIRGPTSTICFSS